MINESKWEELTEKYCTNKRNLLEMSKSEWGSILGLAVVAEMFGGDLGMELNKKYYPLHLFRKSNYKKRRSKNYRRRFK